MQPLNDQSRAELDRILSSYFASFQSEQDAPEILAAEKRLENIRRAGEAFAKSIRTSSGGKDAEGEAADYVEKQLDRALSFLRSGIYQGPWSGPHLVQIDGLLPYCREPIFKEWEARIAPISVAGFSEIMSGFVSACNTAAQELKRIEWADFHAPGQAWREMIGRLADFYNARGYHATARKDRKRGIPPSEFTAFVSAVQFCLPKEVRRHDHASKPDLAGTALETQVARVLGERKRERRAQKRAPSDFMSGGS